MTLAFSVIFWLFFVLSSAAFFIGAVLLWAVTTPFDRNGRLLHLYSSFWAMLYFYVNPLWSVRFEGRDKLPWRGAAVFVSNHQSAGDILVLFGLYRPYKWVSKASIFKAPFLGWNMSLNRYVKLVRGDKESIAKMMAASQAWLERGVPVLMFPEGTRSDDGPVKPFKDGAFRLAIACDCPVFPIAIDGTGNALPKNGIVLSAKSRCVVKVLDPVEPKPFGGSVEALRDHVRDLIVAELKTMRSTPSPEARAPG